MADACRVQVKVDGGSAEDSVELLEQLQQNAAEIDAAFGAPLVRDLADGFRACFVRYGVEGSAGWKTPPDEWQTGMELTAEVLARLQRALEPFLAQL